MWVYLIFRFISVTFAARSNSYKILIYSYSWLLTWLKGAHHTIHLSICQKLLITTVYVLRVYAFTDFFIYYYTCIWQKNTVLNHFHRFMSMRPIYMYSVEILYIEWLSGFSEKTEECVVKIWWIYILVTLHNFRWGFM